MYRNEVIDNLRLDGGALCLDFVNTVPDRMGKSGGDHLQRFNDLICWARKANIRGSRVLLALERAAGSNERKAREAFENALALRDLVYAIFHPISQHRRVRPPDLDAFNEIAADSLRHLRVDYARTEFKEEWDFGADDFRNLTAPIIKSTRDLLLSGRLDRVKECPNCGWLFLDTTKNGRRRWCSMQECGSNVKALEYYYRKKKVK